MNKLFDDDCDSFKLEETLATKLSLQKSVIEKNIYQNSNFQDVCSSSECNEEYSITDENLSSTKYLNENLEEKSSHFQTFSEVKKILENIKSSLEIQNVDSTNEEQMFGENYMKEIFSKEKSIDDLLHYLNDFQQEDEIDDQNNCTYEYNFKPISNISNNLNEMEDTTLITTTIENTKTTFSTSASETEEIDGNNQNDQLKITKERKRTRQPIPQLNEQTNGLSLLSKNSLLLREKFKYKIDYPFRHSSICKELKTYSIDNAQIIPIYISNRKHTPTNVVTPKIIDTNTLHDLPEINNRTISIQDIFECSNVTDEQNDQNMDQNKEDIVTRNNKKKYLEQLTKSIVDSESYFQKCLSQLNQCAAKVGLHTNMFNTTAENTQEHVPHQLEIPVEKPTNNTPETTTTSLTTHEIINDENKEKIKELEKTIKEIDENKILPSVDKQTRQQHKEELISLIEKLKFLASYKKRVTLKSKNKRKIVKEKTEMLGKPRKREPLHNNNFEDVTTQMEFDNVDESKNRIFELKNSVQKVVEWKRHLLNTEITNDNTNQSIRKTGSELSPTSTSNLSTLSKKTNKIQFSKFRQSEKEKQRNKYLKIINKKNQLDTSKRNYDKMKEEKIAKFKMNNKSKTNEFDLEKVINKINQSQRFLNASCSEPDNETRLLNQITPASVVPFAAEYSREKRIKSATIKQIQKKKNEAGRKRKDNIKQGKIIDSLKKDKQNNITANRKPLINNINMSDVQILQNLITDPNARFNTTMTIMPVTVQRNHYKPPPLHKKVVAEKPLEYQSKKKVDLTQNNTKSRVKSPIRAYIMGHHKNIQLNDDNKLMKIPPAYKDMLQATNDDYEVKQKKVRKRQTFFDKNYANFVNNYVNYENQDTNFLLPEKPLERTQMENITKQNQLIDDILSLTDHPLPVNNVTMCMNINNSFEGQLLHPIEQLDGLNYQQSQEDVNFKSYTTSNVNCFHSESLTNNSKSLKFVRSTNNLNHFENIQNTQLIQQPKKNETIRKQSNQHKKTEILGTGGQQNQTINIDAKKSIVRNQKSKLKIKNDSLQRANAQTSPVSAQVSQHSTPSSSDDIKKRFERINNLAKPKRSYVEAQYREYKNRLGPQFMYRMNSIISQFDNVQHCQKQDVPKENLLLYDVLNGLDDIINIKKNNIEDSAVEKNTLNDLTITKIIEEYENGVNPRNKNLAPTQLSTKENSDKINDETQKAANENTESLLNFHDYSNNGSLLALEIASYIIQLVITEVTENTNITSNYFDSVEQLTSFLSAETSSTFFRKLDEVLSQDSTSSGDTSNFYDSTNTSSLEMCLSSYSGECTTSFKEDDADHYDLIPNAILSIKSTCYSRVTAYYALVEHTASIYYLITLFEQPMRSISEVHSENEKDTLKAETRYIINAVPSLETISVTDHSNLQQASTIYYRHVLQNPIRMFISSEYYRIIHWEQINLHENPISVLEEPSDDILTGCGDGPLETLWSDSLTENLLELKNNKTSSLDVCLSNSNVSDCMAAVQTARTGDFGSYSISSSSDSFISLTDQIELINYYKNCEKNKIHNIAIARQLSVCKRNMIRTFKNGRQIIDEDKMEKIYKDMSLFFLYGFLFLSVYSCFAIQPVCK